MQTLPVVMELIASSQEGEHMILNSLVSLGVFTGRLGVFTGRLGVLTGRLGVLTGITWGAHC